MKQATIPTMKNPRVQMREEICKAVEEINSSEDLHELVWICKAMENNRLRDVIKHKVETSRPTEVFIFDHEKIVWELLRKIPSDKRKKETKEETARIEEILKAIRVIMRNVEEIKSI